jgi:hypothetical protein
MVSGVSAALMATANNIFLGWQSFVVDRVTRLDPFTTQAERLRFIGYSSILSKVSV